MDGDVVLALCGDVMTGRGVDQVLAHPADPVLRERYVTDARRYVRLAEEVNGPIPRPVAPEWPWGDSLAALDAARPHVRVVNLETSVTTSGDFAPRKAVHYRMNPSNVACLAAARPDVCVLANNHVLDFGDRGLAETLDVLQRAGLPAAGVGRNADEALRPAVVPLPAGRALVFSIAVPSSGTPWGWAATADAPGVAVLPDLSQQSLGSFVAVVSRWKQPGDLVVVSIHWGPNWGYEVTSEEMAFARALIDHGMHVVHGHSSHHPRPLEAYRGRLIVYGCGDFINDYEGIGGHEQYRADLRLLYVVTVNRDDGSLRALRIIPLQARRMRLQRAEPVDVAWVAHLLNEASRGLPGDLAPTRDGEVALRTPRSRADPPARGRGHATGSPFRYGLREGDPS